MAWYKVNESSGSSSGNSNITYGVLSLPSNTDAGTNNITIETGLQNLRGFVIYRNAVYTGDTNDIRSQAVKIKMSDTVTINRETHTSSKSSRETSTSIVSFSNGNAILNDGIWDTGSYYWVAWE